MAKVLLAVLWNYLLASLVVSGKQVIRCVRFPNPARPTNPQDTTQYQIVSHCSIQWLPQDCTTPIDRCRSGAPPLSGLFRFAVGSMGFANSGSAHGPALTVGGAAAAPAFHVTCLKCSAMAQDVVMPAPSTCI